MYLNAPSFGNGDICTLFQPVTRVVPKRIGSHSVDSLCSEHEQCFNGQAASDGYAGQNALVGPPEPNKEPRAKQELGGSQDGGPVTHIPVGKRTHVCPVGERPEWRMTVACMEWYVREHMQDRGSREGGGPSVPRQEPKGRACEENRDRVRDRKDFLPEIREIVRTKDLLAGSTHHPPLPKHHGDDGGVGKKSADESGGVSGLHARATAGCESHEQVRWRVHRLTAKTTGVNAVTAEFGTGRAIPLLASPLIRFPRRDFVQYPGQS